MFLPDINATLEDFFKPRVQKGAAWLDEQHAGWVERIIPDNLNMTSSTFCICGQVFGSFYNRPAEAIEAAKFGFDIADKTTDEFFVMSNGNPDIGRMAWKVLDRLWLDEVFWRVGD